MLKRYTDLDKSNFFFKVEVSNGEIHQPSCLQYYFYIHVPIRWHFIFSNLNMQNANINQ